VTEPRRRGPARLPRLSLRRQSISGAEASRRRTVASAEKAEEARRACLSLLGAGDSPPPRRPGARARRGFSVPTIERRRGGPPGPARSQRTSRHDGTGGRRRPALLTRRRRSADQPGALATSFSKPAIDLRRGGPPGPARSQRPFRRIGALQARRGQQSPSPPTPGLPPVTTYACAIAGACMWRPVDRDYSAGPTDIRARGRRAATVAC
jgi:hypothetical protein